MFKRTFLLLFISVFFVLMIACSNQEDDSNADNNEEEATQTEETEDAEDNTTIDEDADTDLGDEQDTEVADDNDSEPVTSEESNQSNDSDTEGNKDLPEPIEINDKEQTDTGLIFEMKKITFEEDHIEVHFHADNQSGHYKTLANEGAAADSNLGGITLQDDTGFDYRYVADVDDARIQLDDQEKVDGIARFTGRIQNDAKTLTLKFNPDEKDDSDSLPKFTYEDIEIKW